MVSWRVRSPAVWAAVVVVALGGADAYADVTISTGQTQNMSCSGRVCTPTAADAVLNVGDLENLLASGPVEVTTTGSGVQADNIDVETELSWSTTNVLALDAYQSISVDRAVSIEAQGGVSLTIDDGGSGGALSFGGKGSVSFANLSSQLTINGTGYTLVNTVKSLASAIAANPAGAYAFAGNYNASQDGTYTQSPVTTTFEGTLEGLGNEISDLSVSASAPYIGLLYVGLFAEIGSSGAVRDVRLMSASVVGYRSLVGVLAGFSKGSLSGISVSGKVKTYGGAGSAGGLAGTAGGTITNCSSTATVTGYDGAHDVGGLVGSLGGTMTNSSASGSVTVGARSAAGGLVGYDGGDIETSFATGSVSGPNHDIHQKTALGGLVGLAAVEYNNAIINSYATGAVSGGTAAGGLIGENYSDSGFSVSDSYSSGNVSSRDDVGGFIGYDDAGSGDLTDNYWDTQTGGTDCAAGNACTDPGVTGLSNKQFKSGLPAGFDPGIWAEKKGVNHGLPYLIANPPAN